MSEHFPTVSAAAPLFFIKCFSSKAPGKFLPTKYQIRPKLPNKIFSSVISELLCSQVRGGDGAE